MRRRVCYYPRMVAVQIEVCGYLCKLRYELFRYIEKIELSQESIGVQIKGVSNFQECLKSNYHAECNGNKLFLLGFSLFFICQVKAGGVKRRV